MGFGPNWYQIRNRTCYIQKVSKFYVGKRISIVTCKYVLHVNMYFTDQSIMQRGDSTKLNFKGVEMQKRNVPTERAQRADENNGFICLVIMVISGVMIIKMARMVKFLYFLLMTSKN